MGAERGAGAASLAPGWTWSLEELSHGGLLPRKVQMPGAEDEDVPHKRVKAGDLQPAAFPVKTRRSG